ncbi:hypothetical protein [Helicobacter sp.]|uniref:hypothetical protein n=1 Tax=Helicobacter sp. TaxID=218 RepID=UPI001992B4C5|nr:hypothetical protein [Helicobacter sp.]MBD5165996.1 hypothetical protein [Helicobacter sp.]
MQISTNPIMRETSLAYQTIQKPQENATSFDMLLSMQSNQANGIGEKEVQEESLQRFWDILDLKGNLMVLAGLGKVATIESERLYGTPDKAFEILRQWFGETNPKTMEKILESSISVLEAYPNVGGYLDKFGHWSPKPQYLFEAEKSQAIDTLSEILQGIKG